MNRYHPGLPPVRSLVMLSALAVTSLLPTLLTSVAHAQTPSTGLYAFTSLASGNESRAYGVSGADQVGYVRTDVTRASRWNSDGTITDLHTLANLGDTSGSTAYRITEGVAIGYGYGSNTNGYSNALRWNADGTVTNLHAAANLGDQSGTEAVDISDGVIVGSGYGENSAGTNYALRWNADGTVTNLGATISLGTYDDMFATGISHGVTVGYRESTYTNFHPQALQWNVDGSVTDLHALVNFGTDSESFVNSISNGVSVGRASLGNREDAIRWNADGTVTNLGSLINLGTNAVSRATSISNGFTVGFGYGSTTNNRQNALLWTEDGSATNLQQFVPDTFLGSIALGVDGITGNVAGYTAAGAALWTRLNSGGGNSLVVQSGVTTSITQDFIQGSGFTIVNGALSMPGKTLTIAGGTLYGTGTIVGNVNITSSGILAPGNSPGTLTLSSGNFTMSGGTYSIDIAGLSAGQYDVLNVAAGTSTFTGGTFAISYVEGYTPNVGDFFDIVTTTGGVTGTDTVTVPSGWTFSANGNAGRLSFAGASVVPEANSGLLVLLAGGLAFGGFALRRKTVIAA